MSAISEIKYPVNIRGVISEANNISGVEPDIIRMEGPRSEWVKLIAHVYIKQKDGNLNHKTKVFTFSAKTEKVYRNDSKVDLAVKFTGLFVYTPFILIAKTIYHVLLPLSLGFQIFQTVDAYKKEKIRAEIKQIPPPKDLSKRIITVIKRNCIDIVKTPVYAVAMTIIALFTLVISPFKPSFLYEGRRLFGEALLSLNWNEKDTIWTYAPCMHPYADLKKKEKKLYYIIPGIHYQGPPGEKIHALNNLAAKEL